MNSAEQTVTWLITLGVLESPKKTISDPEGFLQASLKDGVVLCRLLERLLPGTIEKVSAPSPAGPGPRPRPRAARDARRSTWRVPGPARPPLCADRAARRARGRVAGARGAPLCAGRAGSGEGPAAPGDAAGSGSGEGECFACGEEGVLLRPDVELLHGAVWSALLAGGDRSQNLVPARAASRDGFVRAIFVGGIAGGSRPSVQWARCCARLKGAAIVAEGWAAKPLTTFPTEDSARTQAGAVARRDSKPCLLRGWLGIPDSSRLHADPIRADCSAGGFPAAGA